jgi:import inner membrane translocase subunit TIM16
LQQYERYHAANDPKKGGSFYIQSKIFRAKEALEAEYKGTVHSDQVAEDPAGREVNDTRNKGKP